MSAIEVVSRRKRELMTEIHATEQRFVAISNEAEHLRFRLSELRARIAELEVIEEAVGRDHSQEAEREAGVRVSSMIKALLSRNPEGLTLGQLSDSTEVRRQTLSATLYNMKGRGEVVQDEATGRYRLVTMRISDESMRKVLEARKPR